ncbi:IS21 family transposase [Desulfoglaeba alkanexedens]|uniref:IS21 family transposase n=1 Tax=Desulfoglaeba alkanexedens ALDC TaxID=980445 RepID=A0A4V1ERL9_9BACT|nr:IS21 family transposase [Desulfoglaeba alkanexedens]QCQ22101.1 IS21 family transposase [Desulfoglaeba alkanexedens ALDC]
MDQYELIRTGYRVYGKSISELARLTGHSRNTVKKAIRGEPWGYREREHQAFPALGEHLAVIDGWLEGDRDKPCKQRHTARRIYHRLIEEQGFKGSESTVRRYVRLAKMQLGMGGSCAFIPCDPEAGYEGEVDWGGAIALIGGEAQRLKFFCMRSKYSGKHFVRFYPCERQQAFFDGHEQAFAFFGGVFPILIYDNLAAAVRKVMRGKDRQEQEAFSKFKAYYSFDARFCTPGKAHEKGGVEGLVGLARRNYMVPVPEAERLEELNEKVLQQCLSYGSHKMAGRDRTVNVLYEEEKKHLLPLPQEGFSNVKCLDGRVDKYATVVADKNRYSVPSAYAGFKVKVLLYVDRVEIFSNGKKIADHERMYGNNKWCLHADHYLELIQQRPRAFHSARPIRQWRESWPKSLHVLLERFCQAQGETKGIKDFVNVLMLYRDHSAEAIETAVELAGKNRVSTSEGVRHLLAPKDSGDGTIECLSGWPSLPPGDVAVYGQLGGVS